MTDAAWCAATLKQERIATTLQPENNRHVKRATSSIYLLHHLKSPAILIECGFLSNAEEEARLNDGQYRRELALAICSAVVRYQNQTNA